MQVTIEYTRTVEPPGDVAHGAGTFDAPAFHGSVETWVDARGGVADHVESALDYDQAGVARIETTGRDVTISHTEVRYCARVIACADHPELVEVPHISWSR